MIRLLIWSLIWINSASVDSTKPLVLFPDQIEKYPYFSNAYAKKFRIKSIRINTSKKFPDRPIYRFSQYEVLNFSTEFQWIGKQTIFEALNDTLETVISWQYSDTPKRILQNTGAKWEYSIWQWKEGLPLRTDFDYYHDRDAKASTALLYVGSRVIETDYWQQKVFNDHLSLVKHNGLGSEKGRMDLSPYHQPNSFIYTDQRARKTYKYSYKYNADGSIESISHGGRLVQIRHEFSYDSSLGVKQIKGYRSDRLEEIVDYFYNSDGTLRSILTTNLASKEMTIMDFKYSFY